MKQRIISLAIAATFLSVSAVAQVSDAQRASFRTFLEEFRKQNSILSFSVAVVKDDEIVLSESLGWQDHDAEEPTTADTSYLVASITKTFTAATLLAMEADGHISLDADFTTLSDWQSRCQWLARSGIIFGGGTLDNGTEVAPVKCDTPISLRQVLQHRVQGKPGSAFFYNPVVYGRLSNWVEENTERSWRDWMRHYVIEPAKLNNIAAGWRDHEGATALTNLAPPFRHAPEQSDNLAPSALPNPELNASSGIIASVRDLAHYSMALDRGEILSDTLREKMWTPPIDADGSPAPYAHGWFVQNFQGHRLVWHSGWWPDAYAGFLVKAPDDGWTLVALGNTDGIRTDINTLTGAEVEKNPLVAKFLETFVTAEVPDRH
ncbi:serine hydrolase [Alteromonas halophila]|uniref:Serine hydrolase n=2 Tax=Alteromonas halophila TaxID=516698 RepID=A0A918JFR6_9ALTE|nr:serine hydrolase [Alteromonas halophila]